MSKLIKRKRAESKGRTINVSGAKYDIEYCPETGGLYSDKPRGDSAEETDKETLDKIQDEINENLETWELEDDRDLRDEALISRGEY
jgi:hypothetical protein